MQILNQDILSIESGILVHQVNLQGVMGKGLALAIKNKYPSVEIDYKANIHKSTLGDIIVSEIKPDLLVISAVGQNNYGRNEQHTDYKALSSCLAKINELSKETGLNVYIPYGIGCGLGGGDWNTVKILINYHLPQALICKLKA